MHIAAVEGEMEAEGKAFTETVLAVAAVHPLASVTVTA